MFILYISVVILVFQLFYINFIMSATCTYIISPFILCLYIYIFFLFLTVLPYHYFKLISIMQIDVLQSFNYLTSILLFSLSLT